MHGLNFYTLLHVLSKCNPWPLVAFSVLNQYFSVLSLHPPGMLPTPSFTTHSPWLLPTHIHCSINRQSDWSSLYCLARWMNATKPCEIQPVSFRNCLNNLHHHKMKNNILPCSTVVGFANRPERQVRFSNERFSLCEGQ